MWSDGKTWMDLRYTLDEMCNGKHWDDLSDQPMLKKFVHKHTRQYTGLKDQNGVEIYEGDVVEHRSDLSSASEVKYFEGAFIAGSPVTSNALINFNCANNVSVIGNIYENKELLK